MIAKYAIGGAVGATLYLEPSATVDIGVMSAEHLVTIALQTGRAKDHARILQFLEQKASDPDELERLRTLWADVQVEAIPSEVSR